MKTFLFATDFSDHAQEALLYAIPFIKKIEGKLLLFHSYDFANSYVEVPPYVFEKMNEERHEIVVHKLTSISKEIKEKHPELEVKVEARLGSFVNNLLQIAEEQSVAGIIMGTHGASGLRKIIIGSNAASIIGNAETPVLAIPPGIQFEGINKIVYAVDFQDENGFVLGQLKEFADTFDAIIEILYISVDNVLLDIEVYDWYQEAVKEVLPSDRISFKVERAKNVKAGISNYVRKNPADLLVMATHKKNWFNSLFYGSETLKQAYDIQQPLLVFHAGADEKPLLDSRNKAKMK